MPPLLDKRYAILPYAATLARADTPAPLRVAIQRCYATRWRYAVSALPRVLRAGAYRRLIIMLRYARVTEMRDEISSRQTRCYGC